MLELVFLLPFFIGIVVAFLPVQLTIMAWLGAATPMLDNYFSLTPEGLLVLSVISFLFLFISIYSVSYLSETGQKESSQKKEYVFHSCMLFFLASMSMVALADHIIVLWVAIEATTLVSAPLICSVGIALALLGSFFITLSMGIGGVNVALTFSSLNTVAAQLDPVWLKAGFIFILIGYGTKMGLAPMHTWLPDAHSEAPSPASALLSGALLNCAFLGVYKTHKLLYSAGLGEYSSQVLIIFGLVSMLVAAVFILYQSGYKRLLAYSSIENMGIIAFGTGIGGLAAYGAMLHLIHHSLIKSSLFLSAGNVLLGYGSKLIRDTGNMARLLPKTFVAFFAGFAGISGFPPFGLFISELLIIIGAFSSGNYISISIFIFSLILIFAGGSKLIMRMSFTHFDGEIQVKEKFLRLAPSYILLLTSLVLCVWMPEELYQTLMNIVTSIGGGFHE